MAPECPIKRKERIQRYYLKNKEKVIKIATEYNRTHKSEHNKASMAWNKANPQRINATRRKHIEELRDSYVKYVIISRTKLKRSEITKEMIEIYRKVLISKRLLSKYREVENV